MDDFYRLKTTKTKQRHPHGTPQRGDKRKPWERRDKRLPE